MEYQQVVDDVLQDAWLLVQRTEQPESGDRGAWFGGNDKNWSTTVSAWLRLNPDKDLEPGYCDPIQIIGDTSKKGFIFLEFSKDETPRYFRYAIRPLFDIWNPTNVAWADLQKQLDIRCR